MRFVKLLFLLLIAVIIVVGSIANRGDVTIRALPEGVTVPGFESLPTEATLPLYLVLLCAIFLGVVLGLVLELLRESNHRKAKREYQRQARRLDQENRRLAAKAGEEDDDILGLKRS